MKKIYISFLLTAAVAQAQQLSTEVVVDRNIVPQERTASRPSWLTPQLVLPSFEPISLTPATYTTLSPLNRSYALLPAPEGAFAAEKTPYRGYIVAGYFPTLDFGASAGYRIIDKKKLSLGFRAQFNSERYRPYGEEGNRGVQYFANATGGLDLAWHPRQNSTLSAYAQYSFLRETTTYWYPQNTNSGLFGLKWNSTESKIPYSIGLNVDIEKSNDAYRYLGALDEPFLIAKGHAQQDIRFDVSAEYPFGTSNVGMKFAADFIHTSVEHSPTKGFVGITPYYAYRTHNFSALIGLRADISDKFGVMPDISLDWQPVNMIGAWANVTGGSQANSFRRMRQECIYQIFSAPFCLSRIPVAVDGGINIGPFKGIYAGVFGGFAVANDWLMMQDAVYSPFTPIDIKGWHAGAKVGAEWHFIKGEVSADFAPSSYDRAWYLHRDRASVVIDASVALTPLKPLTVNIGYLFRGGRKAYVTHETYIGLGCVSDLSAGAEWRFTDALTVFGRVENILCRRYMMLPWEPSRRLSGLVGVGYKF